MNKKDYILAIFDFKNSLKSKRLHKIVKYKTELLSYVNLSYF